jgi:Ca2+-transporting ATPase
MGLSAGEAHVRLERYGENAIAEYRPRTALAMFVDQFADVMILVLFAAAVVSGIVGDAKDAIVIGVIVALNAAIGVVQEWRAERGLAALKRLTAPTARIIRDGQVQTIAAAGLAPGDLVVLAAGDIVPADLRLLEAAAVRIDESLLTGESVTVEKATTALRDARLAVTERSEYGAQRNHRHLSARSGPRGGDRHGDRARPHRQPPRSGQAPEVPAGGASHRFRTPPQLAVLALCGVIFALGLARDEPPLLMFLTAVSLAVPAIPEALPAVVTISLALGARAMARRNALIRVLPAVETLGSVTHICVDKTGTLTQNKMHVEVLRAGDAMISPPREGSRAPREGRREEPLGSLLTAMALCSDAEIDAVGAFVGDPTETAISIAARGAGYDRFALEEDSPRVAELLCEPKTQIRKYWW